MEECEQCWTTIQNYWYSNEIFKLLTVAKYKIQKYFEWKMSQWFDQKWKKQEKHLAGWSTPFHRVRQATKKSYTGQGTLWICRCQPADYFLFSFLFGRIIVTFFIGNVFLAIMLRYFCFYVCIKIYIIFFIASIRPLMSVGLLGSWYWPVADVQ